MISQPPRRGPTGTKLFEIIAHPQVASNSGQQPISRCASRGAHQGKSTGDEEMSDYFREAFGREPDNSGPAWDGTGLPPVGTACEIHGTVWQELHGDEFSWRRVEIIAHTNFGGSDVAVGRDIECATLGWGIASKFRPIRTPEQIAAEERQKAVDQMLADYQYTVGPCIHGLVRSQAERLYDVGYRKIGN